MSDIFNKDAEKLFNESKERFLNNLAYFKEHNKEIYDTFCNYEPKCPINFQISKNNCFNVSFDSKNLFYEVDDVDTFCKNQIDIFLQDKEFLISKNDVEKDWYGQIYFRYKNQCAKLVDDYLQDFSISSSNIKSMPLLFCMGIGLGYQLYHLLSQVEVQNLILFEPNEHVFYASLYTFDYASVLTFAKENNIRIELFVGDICDSMQYRLYKVLFERGFYLVSLSFIYIHYANDLITKEIDTLFNIYMFLNESHGFFDDTLFALNNTYNLLLQNRSLASVSSSNKYENTPVFIVGNGPSLDKDLDFLRKNQDKALIVACGTAIETLFHEGIQADFYVAVERLHDVATTLNIFTHNDYLDNVILLTTNVVHKNTLKFFKKEIIFAKENEFSANIFDLDSKYKECKDKWSQCHVVNPLVVNMALSALFCLNFSNIYLFGVDNGTKIKGEYHSSKSKLYQNFDICADYNKISDNEIVLGNFGGDVYSTSLYINCINNLEILILLNTYNKGNTFSIINCSDGAFIKNTTPCKSKKLDKNLFKHDLDKDSIKKYLLDTNTFKVSVDESFFDKVFLVDGFNEILDTTQNLLHKDVKTRVDYLNLLFDIYTYLNNLDEKKNLYQNLLKGTFINFFYFIQQVLYSHNDEDVCIGRVHEIIKIIDYFLSDAKELFKEVRNFSMGEHLAITNNHIGFSHEGSEAPLYVREYDIIQCDVDIEQEKFTKRYS